MFLCNRSSYALLVTCFLPLCFACSKSASVGANTAGNNDSFTTEITHEDCDAESKSAVKTDVNNDGRADVTRVMAGSRELCRVLDLNFDGRVDNFLYFDEAGNLRRRESDFDRDGLIDEIGVYRGGKVIQKFRETNLDGKLDTWDTYANEKLTERRRDTNADGKIDQWWTFPDSMKPECPVVATDEDGDGKPDARHDPCKERAAEMAAAAQPWDKPADAAAPETPPADAGEPPKADAGEPPKADAGEPPKADAGEPPKADAGAAANEDGGS